MKILPMIALAQCLAAPLAAQEWQLMTGAEISEALSDRTLVYASAWQKFFASGRTLYNAGQDSWGYWVVRGDQYCSQWPPGDQWECYTMERRGAALRFVGEHGGVTEARYAE